MHKDPETGHRRGHYLLRGGILSVWHPHMEYPLLFLHLTVGRTLMHPDGPDE